MKPVVLNSICKIVLLPDLIFKKDLEILTIILKKKFI